MYGEADPYLDAGEFQLGLGYRWFEAKRHFKGTEEQREREQEATNVVNEQHFADLALTYAITKETRVTLTMTYLIGSWRPSALPFEHEADGIGDTTLVLRHWLLDGKENPNGNISIGGGIKFPTGNENAKDYYPTFGASNPTRKAVDVSIQPGDGGWGAVFDIQMFRRFQDLTPVDFVLFASASYVVNPRGTNRTPSILAGLGIQVDPVYYSLYRNSVPDSYLVKGGFAFPVPTLKPLSASLALRWEGLPPRDLIGSSRGWRRPGYSLSIEPGISIGSDRMTFSLSVPIALRRNRQSTRVGTAPPRAGDTTLADFSIVAGFELRFGGSSPEEREDSEVESLPEEQVPAP